MCFFSWVCLSCLPHPLFLRLREEYFYHAWCENARPIASLPPPPPSPLPPPSSPPPPPPCLSVSLLSLHFIHFHNPSFPPESDDEGAGQAGNVFFFLFLLSASLFPPPSFPRSPKKPSVTRHLVKCKSDSFEGVALNQLSFLSVHVSVSSPPGVH